jgi:ABC-type oligopeptide transport system substrate-binding subunit
MRRLVILFLVLALAAGAALLAGCGKKEEGASSSGNGEAEEYKQVNRSSTESTACAANRKTIAAAAKSYQAMEGKAPTSVQQLVPQFLQSVPSCPSGGVYTLSGTTVTCSVHGN